MKTRDNKGKYAHSKAKDTIAVLLTALIVLGIASYAKDTAKTQQAFAGIIPAAQATSTQEICVTDGTTTYCAPDERALIQGIRLDATWQEPTEPVPTKPIQKPKTYTFKGWDDAIAAIVKDEADRAGYGDVDLIYRLIDCESRWDPGAVNSRGNDPAWSKDWGILQYNDWWQRKNITKECMLDARCSIKQAIADLKAGKANQWACYKIVK